LPKESSKGSMKDGVVEDSATPIFELYGGLVWKKGNSRQENVTSVLGTI